MFGKAGIKRIPLFRIAKIRNFNVWKSQNSQFQCLETKKNQEIQCFE